MNMFYIVGTPIGNMEDITFRAIEALKDVDYVFAEDTRVSKKLLSRYDIDKVVYQYHEHNKHHQAENIVNLLKEGKKIALVTDAGMPCISDPGYEVVDLAHKEKIKVIAIPGVSAMTTAASIAGINMRRFAFEGFLPKKKGRQTLLKKLAVEERTIIFFESPYRIVKTLKDIHEYLGDRYVVITRELTKIYEEVIRGDIQEVIQRLEKSPIKGEIVLIVEGEEKSKKEKKYEHD
jgi:16S rRNA (cytidine1402-2'-O)-methyltransferase